MAVKRKDFQKAATFIQEFLLKLNEDAECAGLRDTLYLALLHMKKYYHVLQVRSNEKNAHSSALLSARGLSPMTPFVDAPDKFRWKWIHLDNPKYITNLSADEESILPLVVQAAKEGDMTTLSQVIEDDPSLLDKTDGIGRTALTYAIHFNKIDVVRLLLEKEADVNVTAHDGSTALHQACHDGNHTALKILLHNATDVSPQDTQGRAPIHWAVTTPRLDCLQFLLEYNVDISIQDKDGLSPSMWACRLDHIEHFELLSKAHRRSGKEDKGFECDNNNRTWLHWSIRRTEPLECLQTLLTTDAAALKNNDGKTVLLTAAEQGSLPACKIILEIAGKQCIHDRDNCERTALHLATIGGHGQVLNFLLENDADIEARDKYNATVWDYAKNGQLHYCQLIIMSHLRQLFQSNQGSHIPNGFNMTEQDNQLLSSDINMEDIKERDTPRDLITPPHPPKRPRTGRKNFQVSPKQKVVTAASPVHSINRHSELQGNEQERNEINTNENNRLGATEESANAMIVDEPPVDGESYGEDIDNVSGGMDVSDIEEGDEILAQLSSSVYRAAYQPCPPPPRYISPKHCADPKNEVVYSGHEELPISPQPSQTLPQVALMPGTITKRSVLNRGQNKPPIIQLSGSPSQKSLPPRPVTPQRTDLRQGISNSGIHLELASTQRDLLPSSLRDFPGSNRFEGIQRGTLHWPGSSESNGSSHSSSGPRNKDSRSAESELKNQSTTSWVAHSNVSKVQLTDDNNELVNDNVLKKRPAGNWPEVFQSPAIQIPGVVEGHRVPPTLLTPLHNAPKLSNPSEISRKKNKKKRRLSDNDATSKDCRKSDYMTSVSLQQPFQVQPTTQDIPFYTQQSLGNASKGKDEGPSVSNGHTCLIGEHPARSARSATCKLKKASTVYSDIHNAQHSAISVIEENAGPLISPPDGFSDSDAKAKSSGGARLFPPPSFQDGGYNYTRQPLWKPQLPKTRALPHQREIIGRHE